MIAFIFIAVILSIINVLLSLFLYYTSIKEREYKEFIRRCNSFKKKLIVMTTALQSYQTRVEEHQVWLFHWLGLSKNKRIVRIILRFPFPFPPVICGHGGCNAIQLKDLPTALGKLKTYHRPHGFNIARENLLFVWVPAQFRSSARATQSRKSAFNRCTLPEWTCLHVFLSIIR